MNTTHKKRIAMQIMIILLGALLLVSLAIPLITATFDSIGAIKYSDTGFKMLGFKFSLPAIDDNEFIIAILLLGFFAYLQLFLSLAIITIGIIEFFIKNEKLDKTAFILMIAGISLSFWYMIEGIIYSTMYQSMVWKTTASTSTWIAFLLCALSFIAYILCKYLIKEEYILPADHPNSNLNKNNTAMVRNSINNITLLKQYKELLDEGVITQEEFDEKKKTLI